MKQDINEIWTQDVKKQAKMWKTIMWKQDVKTSENKMWKQDAKTRCENKMWNQRCEKQD